MSRSLLQSPSFALLLSLLTLGVGVPAPAQSPAGAGALPTNPRPATARTTAADLRAARQAYDQGVQAERAGKWEAAFVAYSEAAHLSPSDRTIALRLEFSKSEVVQEHTQLAERELLGGQEAQAKASLEAALQIDPGFTVARERLQQITAMTPRADVQSPQILGPLELTPRPGIHDFDYRGTTRGAYEELARQFGLTASFDTELVDRQLRFLGDQLNFDDAMRVLGEQTGTFWRPLDAHTFFVAADTPAKRRDYDLEIKKTITLPASETNDEMTETSRVVRDIVGLRRSDLDMGTHTITIRDTAQNVALAEALIDEIQTPHGEFLLDVDLLEVDRSSALNLGIAPPSSAQMFTLTPSEIQTLKQAVNTGTLLEAIQSIFSTQNPLAGSSGLASAIPPLIAFGGGKTIFLATLSGATANFSQTFSVMRSAERVLLRVQDGRPATFFVGEHYPITLALLSGSLAPAANQFNSAAAAASFPRTDYTVGNTPTGIAAGEFNVNNNANQDLAVTNSGVTPGTVSILLGNGDGTFNVESNPVTVGNEPAAVVAGEFDTNNNTNTDLAALNRTDNTVSILIGDGSGGFTKPNADIAVGNGPVAVVSGEFNTTNNSNLDLAVVNQTDGTVSILKGNGDGTFTRQTPDIPVGATPTAITTADFNNDGILDLAVTNSGPSPGTVSILMGNGDGTFTLKNTVTVGNKPSAISSGKFNMSNATNNNAGIAVANNSDETISILLGNGDFTFFAATPATLTTGTGPSALITGDFNNDGLPDLIVANEGAATVSAFLGLGNGTFAQPLSLATGNSPVALATADFNGDGFTDLGVVNQSSSTVSVILNTSSLSSLLTPNAGFTPYPGSEYVDLGLKVHAVPRIHPDGEISLNLQFDISALAGSAVNGIPILSNRTIEQSVRLKAGETSVLAGLMESSVMNSTAGYPGLAEAPGPLGYLTGVKNNQKSETELLIAITPHQLRLSARPDRTFYAGRGEGEAAPAPAPPPAPAPVAAPPGTPGAPAPQQPLQPGEPGVFRPPGAIVPGAPAPGAAPGGQPPGAAPEPTTPPPPPEPGAPQPGPG